MSVFKTARVQDLLDVKATTASSAYTNGAAVIAGGVGIAGKIFTNDTITAQSGFTSTTGGFTATAGNVDVTDGVLNLDNVSGTTLVSDSTTGTTSVSTGAATFAGGVGIAEKIHVGTGITTNSGGLTVTAGGATITAGNVDITAGILNIDNTTGTTFVSDSTTGTTSVSTGAATFAGGVGIAEKIHVGTGITTDSGGVTVTAGGATITAGNVDITDGALNIDNIAGTTFVSDTVLDATDSTTAGSTFAGGIAVAKKIHAGTGITTTSGGFTATAGNVTVTSGNVDVTAGVLNLDQTTGTTLVSDSTATSTSTSSGAATFAGGVGIAENLYVGGILNVASDVTITGDLNVNGTTTTVNSATLEVDDNIIIANAGPASTKDGGFMIERYVTDVIGETAAETSAGHGGNAQAGTATTITLNAGANGTDDFYNGWYIVLTGGTGADAGGIIITDYVGSTKVATVAAWNAGNPSTDTTYSLFDQRYAGLVLNEGDSVFELIYIPNQDVTDIDANNQTYAGLKTSTLDTTGNVTIGGDLTVTGTFAQPAVTTTALAQGAHPYTVLTADAILFISNTAAFTINLPAVSGAVGKSYTFVKMTSDAFDITITRNGSDTIDNGSDTTLVLSLQYERVTLMGTDSGFWVIV